MKTENGIGDEGTKVLFDALKVNTTLTTLHLSCEKRKKKREREMNE